GYARARARAMLRARRRRAASVSRARLSAPDRVRAGGRPRTRFTATYGWRARRERSRRRRRGRSRDPTRGPAPSPAPPPRPRRPRRSVLEGDLRTTAEDVLQRQGPLALDRLDDLGARLRQRGDERFAETTILRHQAQELVEAAPVTTCEVLEHRRRETVAIA